MFITCALLCVTVIVMLCVTVIVITEITRWHEDSLATFMNRLFFKPKHGICSVVLK